MIDSVPIRVCRADCVMPSGDSLELLVSELALGGAFIVSMMPPQIGTRIALMLLPEGHAPVGPIDARVIGQRLDPSNARKSGFELLFPDVDDTTFDALAGLVARFESAPPPPRGTLRGQAEKRQFPRVSVSLGGQVRWGLGSVQVHIKNLSMTGALFVVVGPDPASPLLVDPKTVIDLTITGTEPEETIEVRAEVVRVGQGTGAAGIGVRFLDLPQPAARRVEVLMLNAIWAPQGSP